MVGSGIATDPPRQWTDLDWHTAGPESARRNLYELRPDVVLVDCPEQCSRALDLINSMRGIVPKPISHDELRLRIWRLLERRGHVREVLGDALVELDRRNHVVVAQGQELDLRPTEFRLLAALMERPGAVVSQQELLESAWGDPYCGASAVKLYVSYLRRRPARADVDPVETVRGVGYRYRPRQLEAA
jgi:two-component system, OmpR family, phosphate regulon response regulator PhoB